MLMSRPRIPEFSLKKNLPMPWRRVFFALASRGKKKDQGIPFGSFWIFPHCSSPPDMSLRQRT